MLKTMKTMKNYKYMIGLLLCAWLFAACDNSNAFDEYAAYSTKAQTAWGQSIVEGSNGYVGHVKSDSAYTLADGVDVLEMAFLADDGLAIQMFLFKIELSDRITLRTTLADDKDARSHAEKRQEGAGRNQCRFFQYDDFHSLRRLLARRRVREEFFQP